MDQESRGYSMFKRLDQNKNHPSNKGHLKSRARKFGNSDDILFRLRDS